MKINTATTRLRSRNSPMADGVAGVARPVRRALRPPTMSFSWFRTDIEKWQWPIRGGRTESDFQPGRDDDFSQFVGLALLVRPVVCNWIPVGIIGFNDFRDERMADHVGTTERVKVDAGNIGQDMPHLQQPALLR